MSLNRTGRLKNFISRNELVLALFLIAAGASVRFLMLGVNPPGLNQDEASTGYEAWSLLHYGIDRNGDSWPALFVSWGSGQNVLYSYLSIPFIALFGLNVVSVRLLAALAGTLTLPVFYLLSKNIRGGLFGLAALTILAFNPWHIMISRWALESNLLPFFLILGLYFTILSLKKPWFLTGAAVSFGLSLYAYGTAFLFVPLFLIFLAVFLFTKKRPKAAFSLWAFLSAAVVFLLLALPITVCNAINVLGLGEAKLFGMTLPVLTQTRQAATTAFGGGISVYLDNFVTLLRLMAIQSDGLPYNSVEGLMFAPLFLPLSLIGLFFCLYDAVKRNLRTGEAVMLLCVFACLLSAFVIDVNINRINMLFLPVIWFSAYGLWRVLRFSGRRFPEILTVVLATAAVFSIIFGFLTFEYRYNTETRSALSMRFFTGLGEAIGYAKSLDTDTVYITDSVNAPYIYALFYGRIPPDVFDETVVYLNPDGAFRQVERFAEYRFGSCPPDSDSALILRYDETGGRRVLAVFGNYVVCLQ